MPEVKAFKVEKFNLADKTKADEIVFSSIEDLEQAYRLIDNGKDIYVQHEGLITKILNHTLSTKVYDGTMRLSAIANKE